jgi:hypothetical protein
MQISEIQIIGDKKEIEIYGNGSLQKLSNSENEIVIASQGMKIGQMIRPDRMRIASQVISMANLRLGYKEKSKEEIKAEITLFEVDLNKFQGLTEAEVLLALNQGLDGDFLNDGESVFFNSANFVKWVKKYIVSKKMPALKKDVENKQIAEREAKKDVPTFEMRRATILKITEEHKQNLKENIDFEFYFDCACLYESLEALGIFEFSINEKFEIYALAKDRYKNKDEAFIKQKAKHLAWIRYVQMLLQNQGI